MLDFQKLPLLQPPSSEDVGSKGSTQKGRKCEMKRRGHKRDKREERTVMETPGQELCTRQGRTEGSKENMREHLVSLTA